MHDRTWSAAIQRELGLDGIVRSVRGVLASAMLARAAGMRGIIVPDRCAAEAEVVDGIASLAVCPR
jgi:magnesium chelatase family protein